MRKSFTIFFVFSLFIYSGISIAQDNREETEVAGNSVFTFTNPVGWVYNSPEAVLYDNGPYFNVPGGGPVAGSDLSLLESTTLGMTTLGAGHALSAGIRVADDFTIPAGETWNITTASFYAYQTGSTTTSTIDHLNVRIWDGLPGEVGSNIVFGDSTTNVLSTTEFSNAYRHSETSPGTTRPIMKSTATIGTTLSEGTYWIDWQSGGTLASGPWAPPVAILGQNTTGNAKQSIASVWADLNDGGTLTPQGLPFMLDGTSGNPNTFFDNFDSYTAGLLVACQNPVDWTTWSNAPCGAEDAEVSSAYAYSGANSAKIITNDDFVKPLGNKTTGKWYMSFMYYVPATKSGYFNTMNVFTLPGTFVWGMDVYFDAGGAGRIDTTGGGGVPANTVNFTWAVAQWNQAIVIVDLDTQLAEFWTGTNPLNLTQVATWNWTQGGTKPNSLAVNDFFGATATDEMYIDDYFFSDEMPSIIPVELSAFAANVVGGAVVLNWTTESELNNQGFEVERRTAEGQFVTIGSVQGNGTTTERKQYSYTDAGVETGNYYYRLKQIDFGGAYEYSNEIFVDVTAPLEFALGQNYPNPFNPTTTINFSLAEPTFVKLAIYNLLGEEVEVLKNEYMNAGSFNVSFDASSLPSGMYLYKVETAQFSSVRKMMLMK